MVESVRSARLPTIAVNDAFTVAPWADMLYAADAKWWIYHCQTALKFEGLKVTAQNALPYKAVMLLEQTGVTGFDPDPMKIRTGGNSGYQAIHIAIHAGAARILLLGFDMRGDHFFGKHPKGLRNPDPNSFKNWIQRFPALRNRGAEIINCTPGSALDAFPKMPIDEAIACCQE